MNLPRQSFISFTVQPGTHSNNNRNGAAHHTDFSTARLKSRLSVEINFIMCVGRGDETEYKLPRFKHADGPGCGGPAALCWGGTSSLSAAKQEGFQSWLGAMELPVETDCGGRAQGRCVSRPELESSHPPPLVVFLTLFSSLPGYVAAKAKVYKFLSLPPAHCSRFRGFDDHSLPPGILFEGIARLGTRPCLLFSILDPGKMKLCSLPAWKGLSSWFSLSGMGSCH